MPTELYHFVNGQRVKGCSGRFSDVFRPMTGEFTDNAGTGIDVYSMRQPLGVVAGISRSISRP